MKCIRLLVTVSLAALLALWIPGQPVSSSIVSAQQQAVSSKVPSLAQLPISFETNRGQVDDRVKFLAHIGSSTAFLTGTDAVVAIPTAWKRLDSLSPMAAGSPRPMMPIKQALMRLHLMGSSAHPSVLGETKLPGIVNYFIGNNPKLWHTKIPTYAQVRYHNVYPGTDLVYHGIGGQLEYDFVLRPGADPTMIRLQLSGARTLHLDHQGNLIAEMQGREIVQARPVLYQEAAGRRVFVTGHYVLNGLQVRFGVGRYDMHRPLIIDPTFSYSTYLGGGTGDFGYGIASDSAGDAYVTGYTSSTNFPTSNALQPACNSCPTFPDAFVSKLNPAGSSLVYSTYLGGSTTDIARAIATDSAGDAYITGFTSSTDFPTLNAFQPSCGSCTAYFDAFVTKLNPSGSALLYSTYLGGNNVDEGFGIAVDTGANAYVTGETASTNFPVLNAFQPTCSSCSAFTDDFVTKLSSTGSALVYSTYLGGGNTDIGNSVVANASGNSYVTGQTQSTNFPTKNAFQPNNGGGVDAFATELNSTGSALVYSTYLGGSGSDIGYSGAADASGNLYISGNTSSANFPTRNAFQPRDAGGRDVFVTKLNSSGSSLVYSTYLGGSRDDYGQAIALDSSDDAYLTGQALSLDFPLKNPSQPTNRGFGDAFISVLDAQGSGLTYSTYIGGNDTDIAYGVAADASGNLYATGDTDSSNFPSKNAVQPSFGGETDAFVVKLHP